MDEADAEALKTLKILQRRAATLAAKLASLDIAHPKPAELAPLQQAQVLLARTEAAVNAAAALQRLQSGASGAADGFRSEQTMLAAYNKKVSAAAARQELGFDVKKTEINIDAAHRFIVNAVPDLGAEAKKGLKRVAAEATAKRDGVAKQSLLAQPKKPKTGAIRAAKGKSASARARERVDPERKRQRDADIEDLLGSL